MKAAKENSFPFLFKKIVIKRHLDPHVCNVLSGSVACFERGGEFWVKEYHSENLAEGRTYKVNFCPWCGQQAKKQV